MKTDGVAKRSEREVEIYIHIPFCVRKCAYCDFLSFPADTACRRRYVDALLAEIAGMIPEEGVLPETETAVCSIFFGGGTPSLLPASWIAEILAALRKRFAVLPDAEITIEANPGTVDQDKLRHYRQAGINRISFGCQSFHDEELRLLGRIHTAEDIRQSVRLAREAGFANLNLDLISGIPGQTLAEWEDTLQQAVALSPTHISAYSLIIEEGTPFYQIYGDDAAVPGTTAPPLPEEDTERLMYVRTGEILAEAGYRQYEISNYAREGFACRHNIGYWTGVPYLGYGLGAAGFLPVSPRGQKQDAEDALETVRIRYSHTRDLQTYLSGKNLYTEQQYLSEKDLAAEFMILGLRMTDGIEDAAFEARFGQRLEEVYGSFLDKYERLGFLLREHGRTRLTPAGISVSNPILADIL